MTSNSTRIGSVAAAAGVSVQAVRYYERRGLLPPPERAPSGYRRYADDAPLILRFIKRAQGLGFTLSEIQDLLRVRQTRPGDGKRVLKMVGEKVASVDQRIAELTALRATLVRLMKTCECGDGSARCSILDALKDERTPQ